MIKRERTHSFKAIALSPVQNCYPVWRQHKMLGWLTLGLATISVGWTGGRSQTAPTGCEQREHKLLEEMGNTNTLQKEKPSLLIPEGRCQYCAVRHGSALLRLVPVFSDWPMLSVLQSCCKTHFTHRSHIAIGTCQKPELAMKFNGHLELCLISNRIYFKSRFSIFLIIKAHLICCGLIYCLCWTETDSANVIAGVGYSFSFTHLSKSSLPPQLQTAYFRECSPQFQVGPLQLLHFFQEQIKKIKDSIYFTYLQQSTYCPTVFTNSSVNETLAAWADLTACGGSCSYTKERRKLSSGFSSWLFQTTQYAIENSFSASAVK